MAEERKSFLDWAKENKSVNDAEAFGKLTPKEQGVAHSEYADYTASWLERKGAGLEASTEEKNKAIDAQLDHLTKSNIQINKMLEKIALDKAESIGRESKNISRARVEEIKNFFDGTDKAYENKTHGEHEIVLSDGEMKAIQEKAVVVSGSVTDNTLGMQDEEIARIPHRNLLIYDFFDKIPVERDANGVVKYWDWDTGNAVRGATPVAENSQFPESTAAWIEKNIALRKVGDSIPVSEESLYDRSRFVAEARDFIQTNVDLVLDQQLYNGNGVNPQMFGVATRANVYAPVARGIINANFFDLARVVRTEIAKNKGAMYMPDFMFINSETVDSFLLAKTNEGQYVRPDFFQMMRDMGTNVYMISGMIVVETNTVPTNQATFGDSRHAKIYEEPGNAITIGMSGTDFENDRVRMKVRKRANLLVKDIRQDAFRQIADVDAAIAELEN